MYDGLKAAAQRALEKHFGTTHVDVIWQRPAEVEHGDVATACALQLARRLGKNPRDIGGVLVEALKKSPEVEKVEIAGAGYVNIWLTPAALLEALAETRKACVAKVKRSKDQPVIVEYSQPNIAKPLGVHHLLSTLIGQVIGNLYEHAGFPVLRWNYLGDWGTQFGKLAVAVETWGTRKKTSDYTLDELLDLYVRFHEEAEKDSSLEEAARAAFLALEKGDEKLRAFWDAVISITKKSLHIQYERLHVSFDLDLGESFYEDKMQPILDEGIKKKVFTEGEGGALIVEFPEESGMPPYLVQKSDGGTLYSTRDIAQMRYRIDEFDPQKILIVTDTAQKLHFEQLVETCKKLKWDIPEFENVLVGRMRFADQKMSTRKGTVLKLEEVLQEAVERAEKTIASHGESIQTDDAEVLAEMMGIGAIAYGILSQNRKMEMVFDWDKFLSFDGNSAPYLQYTHARARSVLRKADITGEVPFPKDASGFTGKERLLVGTLMMFEGKIEEARVAHMPHILANYLFQLAQDFNAFYNDESILQAEEPTRTLRLALTSLTASVLKAGAKILTIHVPDRM